MIKKDVRAQLSKADRLIREALEKGTIGKVPSRETAEAELSQLAEMRVRLPDYDEKTGVARIVEVFVPFEINDLKIEIRLGEKP